MNRRSFLGLLASVPVLAKLLPAPAAETLIHSSGDFDGSRALRIEGDPDWIMYDPYSETWPPRPYIHHFYTDGFYEWATAESPRHPVMLAEWGIDINQGEPT